MGIIFLSCKAVKKVVVGRRNSALAKREKEGLDIAVDGQRGVTRLELREVLAEEAAGGHGKTQPRPVGGVTVRAGCKVRQYPEMPQQVGFIPEHEPARVGFRRGGQQIERQAEKLEKRGAFLMTECHTRREICEIGSHDDEPPVLTQIFP